MDGRILLTIDQAASALEISRSHIYSLLMTGDLPSIKIGRSRRILAGALELWARERQEREAGLGSSAFLEESTD